MKNQMTVTLAQIKKVLTSRQLLVESSQSQRGA